MPGLFDPFTLRGLTLRNRIGMPPMCTYSAGTDGLANEWHTVHYASRAVGGVGLIILEATAVESRGRLSDHDLGLWTDEQVEPLRKLVALCQRYGAKVGVQLGHGGRKAWGGEPLVAPSALPFRAEDPAPHELSRTEIVQLIDAWAAAAARAVAAGFDCIELHGAHGYLINQFLSPVANQRTDAYGGSPANRARFAVEVIEAVRAQMPPEMPLLIRVSAVDHVPDGVSLEEMVFFARRFREAGVDFIDVSSGGVAPVRPEAFPGYQVDYARVLREQVGLPTGAVGLITEPEFAEAVIRNQWADIVFLGRELLRHPYWPLHAARRLGVDIDWPAPYQRAKL